MDASDVPMLVAGRSVLLVRSYGDEMKLATYLSGDDPLVVDEEGQGRNVWGLHRFTYIGERGDDGWISWGGGENPVPGRMVHVLFEDEEPDILDTPSPSDRWSWGKLPGAQIIAFRLVDQEAGTEVKP
jgi:hypothetical protein